MLRSYWLFAFLISGTPHAVAAQTQSTVNGSNNQGAAINNGIMNQYNVVVTPPVRERLQDDSKQQFGSANGWLRTITPANDPITADPSCPVPETNLTVLLGEHGSVGSCSFAHCVILADPNPDAVNKEILSVDRKGNSMQVNAVVLDRNGKVIAVVDKNRAHANPTNAFDWRRPDAHTIDITDEYNRNVLHLKLANSHTLIVEGLFQFSDGRSLTVRNDRMVDNFNNTFGKNCSQNARGAAFAF